MRLGRFLDGRSTPEEARAVQAWLDADGSRQELVRRLRRAMLTADAAPGLWDADDAWVRLRARLDARTSTPEHRTALRLDAPGAPAAPARAAVPGRRPMSVLARPRRRGFTLALRAAAVIGILIGGGALWRGRAVLLRPAEVAMQELVTATGEQKRVTLADGSRVVLGPASRLLVPARFGGTREVRLTGEAVFDVAPDRARPFRVHTAHSVTQVIGTRFGVHAVPADDYVEVVVEQGRVKVAAADDASSAATAPAVELTPGLAVRVRADGRIDAPRAIDARRALAWTDGLLVFDDASLLDVVETLERRYGLTIRLADPALGTLRLTAEFRRPTDTEVVRLIALSLGIEYRRVADGFLLLPSTPTTGMSPK